MTYKILIVEDEQDLQELYQDSFEDFSDEIQLEMHSDGESAFQRLNEIRYDLVICDLQLPGLNGMDLIKKLRKDSANMASLIFIVSGFITQDILDFAHDFHDIKTFNKPLNSLQNFAEKCLQTVRTRKELRYDPELLEAVRDSAFDLLKKYFDRDPIIGRCQLSPLNESPTSLRGFIPFSGTDFTGSIAVDLGRGFMETFEKKISIDNKLAPEDMAYEMANELAGEFKASILRKGYDISLGIPCAKTLEEIQKIRPESQDIVFIPAGYIGALFRIEFSMSIRDLSFSKKQDPEDSLGGGEMFLFD